MRLVVNLEHAQAAIAAEVRAELARQQVTDTDIAAHLGENQPWFNRRKNGYVPFSGAELAAVAAYLGVEVGQFFGRAMTGPAGPDGEGQWAPSGSNRRPTDYKFASCQILTFPARRVDLAPVFDLPRRADGHTAWAS